MYGILISYNQYKEWEEGTGRKFPLGIYGDIFCIFDSRDGKFLIIGKKIRKINNDNPIILQELNVLEKFQVETSVKDKFGFTGEFHYYFISSCE
jgi:hypothetical protein